MDNSKQTTDNSKQALRFGKYTTANSECLLPGARSQSRPGVSAALYDYRLGRIWRCGAVRGTGQRSISLGVAVAEDERVRAANTKGKLAARMAAGSDILKWHALTL